MDDLVDFLFVGSGVAPLVLNLGGYMEAGGLLFIVLLLAGMSASSFMPDAPYKTKPVRRDEDPE